MSGLRELLAISQRQGLEDLVGFWERAVAHQERGFHLAVAGRRGTGRTAIATAIAAGLNVPVDDGPALPDAGLGPALTVAHDLRWADALVIVSPCFAFGGAAESELLAWALQARVPVLVAASFPERRGNSAQFALELEKYEIRPAQERHGVFPWALCPNPVSGLPSALLEEVSRWRDAGPSFHARTLARQLRAIHEAAAASWDRRAGAYRDAQRAVTRAHAQRATETARLEDAISSRLALLRDAPRAAFDQALEAFYQLVLAVAIRVGPPAALADQIVAEGGRVDEILRRSLTGAQDDAHRQFLALAHEVAQDAAKLWSGLAAGGTAFVPPTPPSGVVVETPYRTVLAGELATTITAIAGARTQEEGAGVNAVGRARNAAQRVMASAPELEAARVLAVVRGLYGPVVERWSSDAVAASSAYLKDIRRAVLTWLDEGIARMAAAALGPYATYESDGQEYLNLVKALERDASRA
jgi:hypothetical protein